MPHDGSELTIVGKLVSYTTYWLGSSTQLLEVLEPGSDTLRTLNRLFMEGYGGDRYHMVNFFELQKSDMFGLPLKLVRWFLFFYIGLLCWVHGRNVCEPGCYETRQHRGREDEYRAEFKPRPHEQIRVGRRFELPAGAC